MSAGVCAPREVRQNSRVRPLLTITLLLAMATLLAGGAAWGAADSKGSGLTYRWVDDKGVVHYGDRVPAEYATQEREMLNRQGVEVKRLEAQKTPGQLAADAKQEQELAHQKQHDQFLLTTYATIKDIEQLRDLRLDQIEGQIRAATLFVDSLDVRMRALVGRARVFKPYSSRAGAHRMPDDLAEDLVRTVNEARNQRVALENKRAEKEAVRQQFETDIDRYRELKTIQARR